jgi:hypothetical protein
MGHQHFCQIAGHYWECGGETLRSDDTQPSICICLPCGLPLEGFDHSSCDGPVELVACPEHRAEALRRLEVAKEKFRRRAAEFRLREKCKRIGSLPEGPEKSALTQEIKAWILQNFDEQQPEV